MLNRFLPIDLSRYNLAQNRNLWLRPLIIVGVLLFSAGLAAQASPRQLQLIIGLVPAIGVVLVFMRWPPVGLIAAAISGLFIPFYGPSGLNVTMIIVALVLGLWLLDMVAVQRKIQVVPSRTVWPLLLLVITAGLSFGVGQLPWFIFAQHAPLGAQLGGLSIFVLSAATFLLVANQIQGLNWLKKVIWVFLAVAVLYTGRSLIPGGVAPFLRRFFQPVGSVFWIWVIALAFSQAVFNRDLHPGWRFSLGGLVLAVLYILAVLKFKDKSGWLPAVMAIVAIISFRSWKMGLALALLGILPGLYLATDDIIASDEYSVSTRLDAALIMVEIIKANPIFGLGFANYYWYTPLFPIRGFAVQFNSHNNYIDIVAQTGLVGLGCFLWFFWEVGRLGWRLRERVPAGFAQAYVYGTSGGLVAMLLLAAMGDWVLPFFYNVGLNGFRSSMLAWFFLGGLVVLENVYKNSPSNPVGQPYSPRNKVS